MVDGTVPAGATTAPTTAPSAAALAAPSASTTTVPAPTGNGTLEVNKWIAIAESKTYAPDNFRRMNGSDIGLEWILRDESAMKEPIVVENPEGLGMKMPPKETTVRDVANEVGPDTHVEVIGMYEFVHRVSLFLTWLRCSFTIKLPRVDTGEMGRLLSFTIART